MYCSTDYGLLIIFNLEYLNDNRLAIKVRKQSEFKVLGAIDFPTKEAQKLRYRLLQKSSLSFIHQAYRYRSKANYRDAIFLAHGNGVPSIVDGLVDALINVAIGFSIMATGYASVRI